MDRGARRACHFRSTPATRGAGLRSASTQGSMSRSKCVKECRTTPRRCESRGSAPNDLRHQVRAASASGNSGGDQSPPHMPFAGRRCSRTRPPLTTNTMCVRSCLRGARGRRAGSSSTRPWIRAPQPRCNGHRVQAARARVQTVAPRSMIACVYSATRAAGVHRSASCQSLADASAAAGGSRTTNTRASTRFTLPSRIAWRCPLESARIAPAVERPIPGSAIISSSDSGKCPP